MVQWRDRRTLLDKMLALLGIAAVEQPFYFVADAYYAAHKIVAGLLKQNNHLLTRMKSNAVAYTAYQCAGAAQARPPPGLWQQDQAQLPVASLQRLPTSPKPGLRREQGDHPVSGPRNLLYVPPAGWCIVAVIHPVTRGACLLMCTDLASLDAIDIIRLFGHDFIEKWADSPAALDVEDCFFREDIVGSLEGEPELSEVPESAPASPHVGPVEQFEAI